MPDLTYLSLFSGIGGLDLGLDRAGWRCVGQVERDPFCRSVLDRHWPEVPKHDDVRTAVEWWRSGNRPAVRAVVGGFPCQPVSVAGRQLAQADDRWLWPAAAHIVRELRPDWVLLENVPGLLARGLGDVLGDLAACGYDAEWDCVPAAAVGANHRRDRVFVVAYPHGVGWRRQAQLQPAGRTEPEHRGVGQADTAGDGWRPGWAGRPTGDGPYGSSVGAQVVGDTHGQRRTGRSGLREGGAWAHQPARVFLAEPTDAGWWATEPDVGRVAHGVPGRVDRLRALGNAVVPQVAEHIGRLIATADRAVSRA